jgi:hypothetical protein
MPEPSHRAPRFCSNCPQVLYGRLPAVVGEDLLAKKALQDSLDGQMASSPISCQGPLEGTTSLEAVNIGDLVSASSVDTIAEGPRSIRTNFCRLATLVSLEYPDAGMVVQSDVHYVDEH